MPPSPGRSRSGGSQGRNESASERRRFVAAVSVQVRWLITPVRKQAFAVAQRRRERCRRRRKSRRHEALVAERHRPVAARGPCHWDASGGRVTTGAGIGDRARRCPMGIRAASSALRRRASRSLAAFPRPRSRPRIVARPAEHHVLVRGTRGTQRRSPPRSGRAKCPSAQCDDARVDRGRCP